MRLVSHRWKTEFDDSVKGIGVGWVGPLLPAFNTLAQLFPKLASLDLGESPILEASLANISSLRGLTRLSLGTFDSISGEPKWPFDMPYDLAPYETPLFFGLTDHGLASIQGIPLQYLDLSGCCHLGDGGLEFLEGLPLTFLNLEDCPRITDAGLNSLRGLPLTSLSLGQYRGWRSQLTDSGLEHLAELPLTYLDLTCCSGILGTGFQHMVCPLASLNMSGCSGFVTANWVFLKELPLTRLEYYNCEGLTDEVLKLLGFYEECKYTLWT